MEDINKAYLKFIGACPSCNSRYEARNVKLLNQTQSSFLAHCDCLNCESSTLMTVIMNQSGMVTTFGMLTDFTKKDFARFQKARTITLDDVLDLHKSLSQKSYPHRSPSKKKIQ